MTTSNRMKRKTVRDEPTVTAYMTRQAAAELLGVDPRTVDRRIKEGKLRTKKPGVIRGRGGIRVLILREDVEALQAGDVETGEVPR